MSNEVLSVELEIREGNAEVVISRTKQKLDDFIKTAEKAQPNIKFKIENQSFIDLDKLERKADETRRIFQAVAAVRLDNGQIGHLTREIVHAHERSRQLFNDITNIKAELSNPNRKSSIAFLTEELRAAEKEADALNRKLNSVPLGAPQSGLNGRGSANNRGGAANNLKLSGFQKQNLAYQLNDVATMAAMGANPMQILASQAGQIAQIFEPAQIATFTAKYASLVSIMGAGTLAIAATYKITGDIRKEAEQRLKVETMITGAINSQRIAQKEAFQDLQKERKAADRASNFSQFLKTDDIEALKKRREDILRLITPNEQNVSLVAATLPAIENGKVVQKTNESFQTLQKELLELDARIKQVPAEQNAQSLKSFEQRNEEFKKAQQNAIDYEKKRAEEAARAEKKRLEDVEKAKEKVKELQRVYLMTFDQLARRAGADNPFVSIFLDADKALKDLRENIKGLPADLQKTAVEMQQKINLRQLLEAQVGNRLATFDLREQANNFRNPFDSEKQKKDQQEFVERFLRNNPNYLYLQGKSSLDEETRSKIIKQFAPSSLTETPADRLNKSLEEKYNLLYKPGQTAEQLAIADRRFISLTSGANPLDLNRNIRESAAFVREREAARQERYQQDALDVYRKQLAVQEKIEANTKANNKLAEKGGTKAIELTLKDETSGGISTLQKSANPADTANAYYDPNLDFSTGGFSNR